ncbi:hypothetical protein BH11CYA1_BH11CYA1_08260 [soil metagenome]
MTRSIDRPAKTKALLAIAFVSSMLTAPPPALCKEQPTTAQSAIEVIVKNGQATPEEKALNLLQLANCYVTGRDSTILESQLKAGSRHNSNDGPFHNTARVDMALTHWAETGWPTNLAAPNGPGQPGQKANFIANYALADLAIEAATAQLSQAAKSPRVLTMYRIASNLSQITKNVKCAEACTKALNDGIQACEANKSVDSMQIKTIVSILKKMAYGLVPIQIADYKAPVPVHATAVEMKNFDECERLKLRAAALLDRLPAGDQDRRKAHRDLSLWYSQFGKNDKALKEKQELFKLVGVNDDSILYPQPGMCGHVVWWSVKKVDNSGDCGMG